MKILKKLAVVLPQSIWYDGKQYSSINNFLDFVMSFKNYFSKMILVAPISYEKHRDVFLFETDGVAIRPLHFYRNLLEMYRRLPFTFINSVKVISKAVKESDVIFLFEDDITSMLLFGFIKKPPPNTYFWIRADVEKYTASLEFSGIKKLLAVISAKIRVRMNKAMMSRCSTFIVGDTLYQKYRAEYKNIYKIYVSTVTNSWLTQKAIHIQKCQIRLLSVSKLHPVKGLKYLIMALPIVIKQISIPIKLVIIGSGKEERELKKLAECLGLCEKIKFKGYVPFGKELMEFYDNSDIFISSSISEGFPATIFEAMARGVPLICTDVGGILSIIKNGESGLLVEPRNSMQIANAILRLVKENPLRLKLIKNGFEIAKKHTKEVEIEKIMNYIQLKQLRGQGPSTHTGKICR
jgi:glycosyltransferase involved in cell wall biosynthesis